MALCFELESCYPDINPSIFTSTNLSEFLGKYVQVCEACYLVKNSNVTNCPTQVETITVSYDTCQECNQNSEQGVCGTCPEFYELVVLDDGTEICQKQSSYPAIWTGETGTVEPGDRSSAYSLLGLNLLENVTNNVWPIVGYKFYSFATQTCPPPQLDAPFDGPGYWSNWGFKDDWGNGTAVFGQLGYSVYDSFTPTPLQAKVSAIDTNALFRSSGNAAKGRLNVAGIWARNEEGDPIGCSEISDELPDPDSTLEEFIAGNNLECTNLSDTTSYIRYDFCFSAATEKEYLIGFAADNAVRLILDGQPFVALTASTGDSRKRADCDPNNVILISPAFQQWHVVPITLGVGLHTITMIGYNDPGTLGNYAAEVYNLTSQELKDQLLDINLGSYENAVAALEPYILFSTKSFIDQGSVVPIGAGEWVCLDGSTSDPCSQTGQPQCACVSNLPLISCCYKLTNCVSLEEIYTQVDLSQYQGLVVNIQGSDSCYQVEQLNTSCPEDTQTVVVTNSYVNCEECVDSYKLFNCKDLTVTVQTSNSEFAEYVGQVVNLVEYPGDCWQVGPNTEQTLPLQDLNVSGQPFQTCEECNPKEYELTNCVNGVSISSTNDLSSYVGKVIRAENFPGLCFTVTDNACNCLKVTLNGQSYEVQRESNLFNGSVYFQFVTLNNLPIVIAYDNVQNRWEMYNPDTEDVYFYSDLEVTCPVTSVWVKLDPTFPGTMVTETCPLTILNITPSQEFVSCEPCVNC
jgi:hypothetical protein